MAIDDADGFVYELKGERDQGALESMIWNSSCELARVSPDMRVYADILSVHNTSVNLARLVGTEFLRNPAVADVIDSIRVSLNDWHGKIGLGLVSLSVAPVDHNGEIIETPLLFNKPSTIGIMQGGEKDEMVAAGFDVGDVVAAEFVIPATDELSMRSMPQGAIDLACGGQGTMAKYGSRALMIGDIAATIVPVVDRKLFESKGIRSSKLGDGARKKFRPSVYLCQFRTKEGVRKVLGELTLDQLQNGVVPWEMLRAAGF